MDVNRILFKSANTAVLAIDGLAEDVLAEDVLVVDASGTDVFRMPMVCGYFLENF